MNWFHIFTVALLGALLGGILGALYLQVATRVVAGFKPTYVDAYQTSFLAGFAFAALLGLACLTGIIRPERGLMWDRLAVLLFFVTHLCVYSGHLIHPRYGYVGMGRASVIVLLQNAIALTTVSIICWFVGRPAPLDQLRLWIVANPQKAIVTQRYFATAQEAQEEALRRYPELGVEGSRLHREFLSRYRRYQSERPSYFLQASWPVTLAEESVRASR